MATLILGSPPQAGSRAPPSEAARAALPALDAATRPAGSAEWRAVFAELGVDWAYGTELAFNAPLGLLRVTHAPEVLDRIDAVLRGVGAIVSEPVAEEESDAP